MAAPDVRRLHPHRHVHQPQIGVIRRGDPGIGRVVGVVVRRRRQRVLVLRPRIPRPHQLARVHVEPADHPRWLVRRVIVDHRPGHDHDPVAHHRRRGRLVEAARLDAHAFLQVERAVIAEAVTGFAAVGIERDHPPVIDRQENPPRTVGPRRRAGRILVIGDAAARQVLEGRVVMDLRIIRPPQRAGLSIQRDQFLMQRTQVQRVADLDRRNLER